jgi:hypothetical protein
MQNTKDEKFFPRERKKDNFREIFMPFLLAPQQEA